MHTSPLPVTSRPGIQGETVLYPQPILYAAGRFRKACDLTRLLGRAARIELVEILGIALFWAKFLPDLLHQDLDHGRDLILLVVIAEKIYDLPMLVGHLNPFH